MWGEGFCTLNSAVSLVSHCMIIFVFSAQKQCQVFCVKAMADQIPDNCAEPGELLS